MHPACVCAYMHTLVIKVLIHHLLLFNHVHQHVSLCINRGLFATTRFPREARNSFLGIRNNSKHIVKCLPNGRVVLCEILASKPERLWDSLHILSCFWLHPGVWQTIRNKQTTKKNQKHKCYNNKNIAKKCALFSLRAHSVCSFLPILHILLSLCSLQTQGVKGSSYRNVTNIVTNSELLLT